MIIIIMYLRIRHAYSRLRLMTTVEHRQQFWELTVGLKNHADCPAEKHTKTQSIDTELCKYLGFWVRSQLGRNNIMLLQNLLKESTRELKTSIFYQRINHIHVVHYTGWSTASCALVKSKVKRGTFISVI